MMVKEATSSNYLFFRFPTHYALFLGPFVAGVTNFFINPSDTEHLEDSDRSLILDYQYNALLEYLNITKLFLAIICAFFITYKWTVINKDGSYGYFLTQGIDRGNFYIRSALIFLINGYLGILAGILILNYLGGIYLTTEVLIWVLLLSFSSTLFVISTSIFLAEAMSHPELSSFIIVIIFGLNANLNSNESSFWFKLFKSELLFADNTPIIPFLLSFGLGTIFMVSGYLPHKRLDVEL